MTVQEMIHKPTIERCLAELDSGLDVHRWFKLWEADGRKIDDVIAIAFYHQAIQDAREALVALTTGKRTD